MRVAQLDVRVFRSPQQSRVLARDPGTDIWVAGNEAKALIEPNFVRLG